MRIAQISDTHISLDAPSRLADLERCVAQIEALSPHPDAVVHTGDVSHNGLPSEFAAARRALDRLSCPYFVIPGNKDPRAPMVDAFFDGHLPSHDHGLLQYAVEAFGVRLILLDTSTPASNKGAFGPDRLRVLETLLCVDASRPAALFMHHPPFSVPVGPDAIQFADPSELDLFSATVARYPSVCGIFCGHVHRPATGVVGTADSGAIIPATVMTASALDRRFGETEPPTDATPLYLLHEFDA